MAKAAWASSTKPNSAPPVRRIVALKAIKLGMDTKVVLARFEAERQALALMSHANIARVLNAGATKPPAAKATADLIRAMARQQLKKSAQAKELLDAAMIRIDSELTKPGAGTINSPENWLICHIFRREAEQLITGKLPANLKASTTKSTPGGP